LLHQALSLCRGIASVWKARGTEILIDTKVKQIPKRFTAFNEMFRKFAESKLAFSFSSNGFPDLESLVIMMKECKKSVEVFDKPTDITLEPADKL
jgi:DNA adenine methylase/adenine-specific DNA-methyltransferase